MSTMATKNWNSEHGAVALPSHDAGKTMHEMITVMRDTIVVLLIQIAFRATLMLRRWNY